MQKIWHNKRSIEILLEIGLLNKNTLLVHCGHLLPYELESIAKYNAKIVLCPVSNTKLSTKTINLAIFDDYNISVFK